MTYPTCPKRSRCSFGEACRALSAPKQGEIEESRDGYYLAGRDRSLWNYVPGEGEIF